MPKGQGGEIGSTGSRTGRRRGTDAGPPTLTLEETRALHLVRPLPTTMRLLESKLAPPIQHARTVSRTRLLAKLRDSKKLQIVAVVAPSGFGKTTLLTQWAGRDRRPFAWLSLDERDNEPLVLLKYLAAAMAPLAPIEESLFKGVGREAAPEMIVAGLASALRRVDRPIVLVIDDAHLLTSETCVEAVLTLADNLGKGSQLVMAGRPGLGFPIASLRAQGRLGELDRNDLAMTVDDAAALYDRMHVMLDRPAIENLVEITEGLPAALALLGLSLEDGRLVPPATLPDLQGEQSVMDYLREEFLTRVPRPVLTFLTRSSVLIRMSGPLCDEILERKGSARILDDLSRQNMLLVSLDQHGEWYRFHHLLQQLLRTDLERREPERARDIVSRAVAWCERHGLYEDALEYAMELGDAKAMARLLEALALESHRRGDDADLLRWLGWFEEHDLLGKFPRLAAAGAWLHLFVGQPATARRWAAAAEDGTRALPSDQQDAVRALLMLFRAAQCGGGPAQMKRDATEAIRMFPSAIWHPVGLLMTAMAERMLGAVDDADPLLVAMFDEAMDIQAFPTATVALTERAVLAIEQEEWATAERLVERALEIVTREGLDDYVTSVPLYAVAARVAIQSGEVAVAKAHLAHTQRLRDRVSYAIPFLAARTRLELARAYLALTDAAGARAMLRELDSLFTLRPDLGVFRSQAEEIKDQLESITTTFVGGSSLTAAELRLLPMLATQYSFREIAEHLFVSRHTVKTQAISIYRKLRVTSRTAAVEAAREAGILSS
jgi:LuxR family transcriptional regulator, maltose regulon positive regulatory protein